MSLGGQIRWKHDLRTEERGREAHSIDVSESFPDGGDGGVVGLVERRSQQQMEIEERDALSHLLSDRLKKEGRRKIGQLQLGSSTPSEQDGAHQRKFQNREEES